MGALYSELYKSDLRLHLLNPGASYLFTCWELARRDSVMPLEGALARHKLDWLLPDMMIIRQREDGELYYAHYGSNVIAHAGFNMRGKAVAEFKGVIGDFYLACYASVLVEERPLASVHRLGNYNERPMWERVMLPVMEETGKIAIYVFNRVRKLADDFVQVMARANGNGVLALQFRRDGAGIIVDACITGANKAALDMTGRRLDQLLERSIRDCFPGIIHHALWEKYLEVNATRQEMTFPLDYRCDGLDDVFDVRLAPFRDGVTIDFRIMAAADAAAGPRISRRTEAETLPPQAFV
jgi:PAS domain-containing protein